MFNPASGSGVQHIFEELWEGDSMMLQSSGNANVFLRQNLPECSYILNKIIRWLQAVAYFKGNIEICFKTITK